MDKGKTTSNQILKSINQQKVLRLIFTHGPISRVELAEQTGLTQQTITNIVRRLLDRDIIKELKPRSYVTGRKPIPLVIHGESLYGIGIEIAVKYVRGSLMNFSGETIYEISVDVPKFENPEHPMQYIYEVVDQLLTYVPDPNRLKGIGCSIQGLVDSQEGKVIYSPGLKWNEFPLRQKLEERYQMPIYIENDANLLALVENLNGVLSTSQNNITFKFDYGIGAAVFSNKQLVQGAAHVAGELGHYKFYTGEDALLCHCGGRGCLTTHASVSGLIGNGGFTLEELEKGVLEKEDKAMEWFQKMTEGMVQAIGNLITVFNPDHVIFTGKIIEQLDGLFVPSLTDRIRENIPKTCQNVKMIRLSASPDESTLAVGLVMDNFFGVPIEKLTLPITANEL